MSRLNSFYKAPLYVHPEAEDLLEAIRQEDMRRAAYRISDADIAEPVKDEDRIDSRTGHEILFGL